MGVNLKRYNKMNYIKQSIWALAAITMVACSSDDDKDATSSLPPVVSKSTSFTASIESGNSASAKTTRTELSSDGDNPYPKWVEGDQIKVLNKTTNDSAYFSSVISGTDARVADFSGEIAVNNTVDTNEFYALYNANVAEKKGPTMKVVGDSVVLSATIPATQSSEPGFHPEYHFMTAYTDNTVFKFKNAMSLFKIYIADNNYDNFEICRIRFTANNTSEAIAGTFSTSVSTAGTLNFKYLKVNDKNKSNEIVIGDGVNPLNSGYYYIAILPCKFTQGFTLSLEDDRNDNHVVYDRIRTSGPVVGASEIKDLGTYTAKACAKEAYVDLGLTNSSGQKILWCVENVYDEAGTIIENDPDNKTTTASSPSESYYAWGETYVKSNQYKTATTLKGYSWYYTYSLGEGTTDDGSSLSQRSYKYGVGTGGGTSGQAAISRWTFPESTQTTGQTGITGLGDTSGVLRKYNSLNDYKSSISDWSGGKVDNLTELETVDDAAYQKSPRHIVRITSENDFDALKTAIEAKTLEITDVDHKYKLITNKSTGNYIKLPIYGYRHRTTSTGNNTSRTNPYYACYWTINRSSAAAKSYQARTFVITSGNDMSFEDADRCQGRMLRGVIYR